MQLSSRNCGADGPQRSALLLLSFDYYAFSAVLRGLIPAWKNDSPFVARLFDIFVADAGDLADDAALGHDLIAPAQTGHHGLMFLRLLLLRADEQKIHDREDQDQRHELLDAFHGGRPFRWVLGRKMGLENLARTYAR